MWKEGVRIYGIPGVHNNFPVWNCNQILTLKIGTKQQEVAQEQTK